MDEGVWGNVREWGLVDHSDGSPVTAIDPVCGRQVDEAGAAGKTTYAGVVYCFCSRECKKRFDRAPGEYSGHVHAGRSSRIVDINAASVEDLRSVLPVDEESLRRILKNRPYQGWADFKVKNPGFSGPMLRGLKESGVMISTPNLNHGL